MWWDTYKALWWQFWGWRWGEYNLDKLELFTDRSPSLEIKITNPTVEYSPLQVLHLPGANLPPGGWDGLGEMEVRASWWSNNIATKIYLPMDVKWKSSWESHAVQVVGHFTVHGLSVSVSVNTGAGGGVQANINTNNNVGYFFCPFSQYQNALDR